jgi:hypothetical protein
MGNYTEFRQRLEHLINTNTMENGSSTPDFILAEYLVNCLKNFDETVSAREKWFGRGELPNSVPPTQPPNCT